MVLVLVRAFVVRVAVICVAAAFAAGGSSSAALAAGHVAAVRSKCLPDRPGVLVADDQAVAYRARNRLGQPEIFGCSYRRGRSYALGAAPECTASGCGGVEGGPVLAGSIVAYELQDSSPCCDSWVVFVRDLRSGRLLHRLPTGAARSSSEVGGGFTAGLVVKADGAVAWITAGGVARGGNQVHVVDRAGSRVVASGTDVAERSLALSGSTLYWTQAGKPFSTTIN